MSPSKYNIEQFYTYLHVCFYYFKNIFFLLYSHFICQILSLTFILKKYERVQISNCLLNVLRLIRELPCSSEGKESACNAGDPGSTPGSGRSPGERNGQPTPVFLPGTFHRWRSLEDSSPWGSKTWTLLKQLSTQG